VPISWFARIGSAVRGRLEIRPPPPTRGVCYKGSALLSIRSLFVCTRTSSRSSQLAAAIALSVAVLAGCPAASAQVAAHYSGTQIMLTNGTFTSADGIAVDSSGNLFVADPGSGTVYEVPLVSGVYGQPAPLPLTFLIQPTDVAVDGSGDLYVTDCGGFPSGVYKVTYSSGYSSSSASLLGTGASGNNNPFVCPTGVAVDAAGNVFVADEGNANLSLVGDVYEITSGSGNANLLGGGAFIQPYGIAVNSNNQVFVSDQSVGHFGIFEIASPVSSPGTLLQLGTTGASFQAPSGLVFNRRGDLLVVDSGLSAVLDVPAAGGFSSVSVLYTMPAATNPPGLAVDSQGNFYLDSSSDVYQVIPSGVNLGAVSIGSSVNSSVSMVFNFDTGGTIAAPAVLTRGAANGDFSDVGTGSCTSQGTTYNWTTGQSCSVNVTFTPVAPGLRMGAVNLSDNSAHLLGTGYVNGVGVTPEILFLPAGGAISFSGVSLSQPQGVAVDDGGNVYIADITAQTVYEYPLGSSVVTVINASSIIGAGYGSFTPENVAVDGAGNVFVADSGDGVIWEVQPGSSPSTFGPAIAIDRGLSSPGSVAVDGKGNIYIAETGGNKLWEMQQVSPGNYGTAVQIPTCGTLNQPYAITVDAAGNVYTADYVNNRVLIDPPGGCANSQETVIGGLNEPTSVAVDANADVFIANYGGGDIVMAPASNYATTAVVPTTSLQNPFGVALDGFGNLYISDATAHTAFEELFSQPPALAFSTSTPANTTDTTDGSLSVELLNEGNALLSGGLSSPLDFQRVSGASSPCSLFTFSLAPGTSCNLFIEFAPTQAGNPLSESFYLFDNSLTTTGVSQQINLTGYATTPPPVQQPDSTSTAVTVSPSSPEAGQAVTITVVVTDITNSSTIPTGSVTLTDAVDGGNPAPLNGGAPVQLDGTGTATLPDIVLSGTAGTAHVIFATYGGNAGFLSSQNPGYATLIADTAASVAPVAAAVSFGPTNVGSPVSQTLTFNFSATGLIGTPVVVTQGAPGLDFTDAGSGTCDANGTTWFYNNGDNCTVVVNFTPASAGIRYGAVLLEDGSGNVLATTYVSGTGLGPQVVFLPGIVSPSGSGLNDPNGLVIDASGDIYVANTGASQIVELTAPTYTTSQVLGGGFSQPQGVAIDGAGNVFVGDGGNGAVKEIPVGCTSSACVLTLGNGYAFQVPYGVAVDGQGNLFVSDSTASEVYELPVSSGYPTVTQLAPSFTFSNPYGIAVDGNSNVFVADQGNSAVREIVAMGGYATVNTLGSGFTAPQDVAVDGSGNVYVADAGNFTLKEILAPGGFTTVQTLGSGYTSTPDGIAVDGAGNLFLAIAGNASLTCVGCSGPPALTFATVTPPGSPDSTDNPITVTLLNNGNANLLFTVPATGVNPAIVNASYTLDVTTSCPQVSAGSNAGTLAPGASCAYAVDFTPQSGGSNSGSLAVSDNNLSNSAASQTVTFNGTGSVTTLTLSPEYLPQPVVGTSYSEGFTGSGGSAPYAFSSLGTLPPGLTLSSAGLLSGTPAESGLFDFTVQVTDSSSTSVGGPFTASQDFSLSTQRGTASIALGNLAQTYTGQALAATATTTPASLTVNISYMQNGQQVAAPTSAGSYTVAATINDPNYSGSATGTLLIAQAVSGTSLSSDANPGLVQNTITFSASVTSAAGTPTGTVNFVDGTTPLGSAALNGGVAAFSTSTLTAGQHSISAIFAGNASFAGSSSSALSETLIDFSVGNSGAQTVDPGGSATYSLNIAPSTGTSLPISTTLTVTDLPAGATATLTAPGWEQQAPGQWTLPAFTQVNTVSLTFSVPSQSAAGLASDPPLRRLPPLLWGTLLLPLVRRWKRAGTRFRRMGAALFLAVLTCAFGLSGCGATNNSSSSQSPQTYDVTVTVMAGPLSHSTQLTLTVE
jgi:sugar lactone lactonase YvrE